MNRYKEWTVYKLLEKGGLFLIGMSVAAVLASCGNQTETEEEKTKKSQELIDQNPDIFGWLVVPDTNIDYPIAQSLDGDDTYYKTHDITGTKESEKGGIYIESVNMNDMCDFNTVIYGSTTKDGDMFSELWNFADEDFFNSHETFMIAIADNILTYEVWTAYARDNNDVMHQYDFTEAEGCQQYLDDMKKDWTSATNIRSEWEQGATPDNFLVSLVTVDPEHPDKQWVVVGCLIDDQNGTIDRNDEIPDIGDTRTPELPSD
ncbi:class B sortase [Butyrivibrio sp. AD3002]|uniref:class B sortase n=1 Tax=Butyrivibrio sp. AD3002 TaxID=1280670 RepID=UPI0003B64187|nr:class B sortase [Butyrivibrio sp. AD3002]